MNRTPKRDGLYDPQWEHDACGIGAVVNICGRRDHAIVEQGKQILLNLMHRGAAGADEATGGVKAQGVGADASVQREQRPRQVPERLVVG